ncbi:MAG: hypothetical protein M3N68_14015 [Actinomycetota bacterium]|nr:hypothetical protein [Actinomycetota bacterium]
MGADGFAVDYEGLAALGQQLAELRGELENGEDAIGPLLGTGSDDELRGKLSEFAENWSEKRYSVTRQLERWRAWPRRPPMRIATSTRPMPRASPVRGGRRPAGALDGLEPRRSPGTPGR